MRELISQLGLDNLDWHGDDKYSLRAVFDSSNLWSKVFDRVAAAGLSLFSSSVMDDDECQFLYTDGKYEIELRADFVRDTYEINVRGR